MKNQLYFRFERASKVYEMHQLIMVIVGRVDTGRKRNGAKYELGGSRVKLALISSSSPAPIG
jgi:hypothetical protein